MEENPARKAIALYQQILEDETLRRRSRHLPTQGGQLRAATIAENKIGEIISNPQARGGLYSGRGNKPRRDFKPLNSPMIPPRHLAVAQIYVPTRGYRCKLHLGGSGYSSKPTTTPPALYPGFAWQIYLKKPARLRQPVLEALARNYLKMPDRLDAALARSPWSADRLQPDASLEHPLVLPDGQVLKDMTFRQAHDAVSRYSTTVSIAALPDLHLPTKQEYDAYQAGHPGEKKFDPFLPESPDLIISNVSALLVPSAPFVRNDRLITWTSGWQRDDLSRRISGQAPGHLRPMSPNNPGAKA